jgi:hypothetical protein
MHSTMLVARSTQAEKQKSPFYFFENTDEVKYRESDEYSGDLGPASPNRSGDHHTYRAQRQSRKRKKEII